MNAPSEPYRFHPCCLQGSFPPSLLLQLLLLALALPPLRGRLQAPLPGLLQATLGLLLHLAILAKLSRQRRSAVGEQLRGEKWAEAAGRGQGVPGW